MVDYSSFIEKDSISYQLDNLPNEFLLLDLNLLLHIAIAIAIWF